MKTEFVKGRWYKSGTNYYRSSYDDNLNRTFNSDCAVVMGRCSKHITIHEAIYAPHPEVSPNEVLSSIKTEGLSPEQLKEIAEVFYPKGTVYECSVLKSKKPCDCKGVITSRGVFENEFETVFEIGSGNVFSVTPEVLEELGFRRASTTESYGLPLTNGLSLVFVSVDGVYVEVEEPVTLRFRTFKLPHPPQTKSQLIQLINVLKGNYKE